MSAGGAEHVAPGASQMSNIPVIELKKGDNMIEVWIILGFAFFLLVANVIAVFFQKKYLDEMQGWTETARKITDSFKAYLESLPKLNSN